MAISQVLGHLDSYSFHTFSSLAFNHFHFSSANHLINRLQFSFIQILLSRPPSWLKYTQEERPTCIRLLFLVFIVLCTLPSINKWQRVLQGERWSLLLLEFPFITSSPALKSSICEEAIFSIRKVHSRRPRSLNVPGRSLHTSYRCNCILHTHHSCPRGRVLLLYSFAYIRLRYITIIFIYIFINTLVHFNRKMSVTSRLKTHQITHQQFSFDPHLFTACKNDPLVGVNRDGIWFTEPICSQTSPLLCLN